MYASLGKSLVLGFFVSLLNILQFAAEVFLNINIFNRSFYLANHSLDTREVRIVFLPVTRLAAQVAVILIKRLGYTI